MLNPTLIVGPLLIDVEGESVTIVKKFFGHEMPAVPKLSLALVDVRDVAVAHLLAMTAEETNGHRILITWQPSFWFKDMAKILQKEFRPQGYSVSTTYQASNWFMFILKHFNDEAKTIYPRLDLEVKFDNTKSKELLGMKYTPPEKSLIDMVYSMIDRGMMPKKSKYRGPREPASDEKAADMPDHLRI